MRSNSKVILIAVVILLFCGRLAFACTCSPSTSVAGEFRKASSVFVGTVTKITTGKRAGALMPLGGEGAGKWEWWDQGISIVSFDIRETFKGAKNSTVEVLTSSSTCNYPFAVGESYVVYAFERGDARKRYAGERLPRLMMKAIDDANRGLSRLETSLCTRNEKLENAQAEVAALRSVAESVQRNVSRKSRRKV